VARYTRCETSGDESVPLSASLRNVDLTFACKRCSHPIIKSGTWVIAISTFKRAKCKGQLHLGYSDKVELFAKYENA
jgi:hypothetical protein